MLPWSKRRDGIAKQIFITRVQKCVYKMFEILERSYREDKHLNLSSWLGSKPSHGSSIRSQRTAGKLLEDSN